MKRLTQRQLDGYLRKWQPILRLADWEIKAKFASKDHLEEDEGECVHTLTRKAAVVRVLRPKDFAGEPVWTYDGEYLLVHELIHLHFAPFQEEVRGTPRDVAQEQAIDAMARAFVELDRSTRKS